MGNANNSVVKCRCLIIKSDLNIMYCFSPHLNKNYRGANRHMNLNWLHMKGVSMLKQLSEILTIHISSHYCDLK